ncbi:MAG: leucine-rich repeat protein [Lachnospiraceae bacterium]|nr:leucine-rich repeat protein [Lachnospiraceae bacterium]
MKAADEALLTELANLGLSYTVDGNEVEINGYTGNSSNLVIPYGVTAIGENAFKGSGLINVEIPDSVTSIGSWAFMNCKNLSSIEIPDSVTSLGKVVFYGCINMKSITIPNTITSLGYSFLYNCKSLTNVEIPDSVTNIGPNAFEYCSGLTEITIPDNVTSIESSAFENCSGLTHVEIPDSVTSIDYSAFCYCSSLTSVTLPDGITNIEQSTFRNCSSLTDIVIPDSVTYIGDYAFSDCSSLTDIVVPDGITEISYFTFSGCSSLTNIVLPGSIETMQFYAFYGSNSIENVFYRGDKDRWEKIEVNYNGNLPEKAHIHYNVTGKDYDSPTFGHTYEWRTVNKEGSSGEYVRVGQCIYCNSTMREETPFSAGCKIVVETEDYLNTADVVSKKVKGADTRIVSGYDKNESLEFTFTVEYAGYYDTGLIASRKYVGNSVFNLVENGKIIAKFIAVSTGSLNTFCENAGPRIYLEAGVHNIELVAKTGHCYVDKLVFMPFVPCDTSEHIAGEWMVAQEATTSREGIMRTHCTTCGMEITLNLPRIYCSVSTIQAEDYTNDANVIVKNIAGNDTPVAAGFDKNDIMEYTFTVARDGFYDISLFASKKYAGQAVQYLYKDGETMAQFTVDQTGSWSTFTETTCHKVLLYAGEYKVQLVEKKGSCYVDKLVFNLAEEF